MKTMTCTQLGGPCSLEHHEKTAGDVIKAQDRHLKEAERAGDATHQEARDAMKGRWRHPKKSMDWYNGLEAPLTRPGRPQQGVPELRPGCLGGAVHPG